MQRRRRLVEGVDDETWALLAGMARLRQMTIGQFLTELVRREADRVLGPVSEATVDTEEEDKEEEHGSSD